MQIIVDDKPLADHQDHGRTVQQLAEEVCGDLTGGSGRLIVGLSCDGNLVPQDQLEGVLASPVRRFDRIELRTVSVQEQVRATLDQALEVFDQAHRLREEVADGLDQGRREAAMAGLQNLLEIFKQVQETTLLSSRLLGIPLESVQIGEQDLAAVLAAIKERLNALKTGMERQDLVFVSDTLRYEFAEPINAWRSILGYLQAKTGSEA